MARSKKAQETVDGVLAMQGVEGQVGLGVDIVEIERMRRILERTPSFARKVFSEAERAYCDGKAQPEVHYATRFAAKEAVVKALGTGFSEGIGVRDIEVRRTSKGGCMWCSPAGRARWRASRACARCPYRFHSRIRRQWRAPWRSPTTR